MDASRLVAEYFETLVERCSPGPTARRARLPKNDRVIFYVVSTRCEIDINGFNSVFDQLLTEAELLFLIDALNNLGASKPASLFEQAHSRLRNAGFYDDDGAMVSNFDHNGAGLLGDVEEAIQADDSLWELDEYLARLIPGDAK